MKRVEDLRTIAYGLLLFYGITFLTYIQLLGNPAVGRIAQVLALGFLVLIVGIMGVLQWREWGRLTLVTGNSFLFAVGAILCRDNPHFFPLAYLFILGITVMFYSLARIKALFQPLSQLVRKSVLIVDDDEGVIRTVQKVLLPSGYSVLTATTGEKGLQVAKLQKPDLIILDVILPGLKGREVCAVLKEDPVTQNIPVLFLTAKDSLDDIQAEMAVGGEAHLTKPVNAKVLLAEVRKIIG